MVYIGNSSAANFSTVTKDTFSGNASTTAFTLSKTATTNGVAVYVENVRQIPTTAYAVSGTTLTFTGAPPSGTNNIYVMHHNTPVSTATHPSAQALEATSGTFSSDVAITGKTGMGISSTDVPDGGLHVHTGSSGSVSANSNGDELVVESSGRGGISILTPDANESNILFGSPSDNLGGFITYKQSTATMEIGTSISSGVFKINSGDGSLALQIDGNGHVTKPLQSAFQVKPNSDQSDIAVGSDVTVVLDTEIFDQNADFASNTFTAPVTGKYQINVHILLGNIDSAATLYQLKIITSNRTYYYTVDTDFGQDNAFFPLQNNVLADMDASDTCVIKVNQSGGSSQTDILSTTSVVSGYLVC